MRGMKTELMVGIFAIVALAILSFMTFKVGGFDWGKKDGYVLYVYFQNIAGMDKKTKIRVAGVEAGVIEDISLSEGKAKLALRIYPEVKVYSDATAIIKATGLLGDKFLQLEVGSLEPVLKNGDTILNAKEIVDVDSLIRNLSELSLHFGKITSDVMGMLSDETIKGSFKETMVNLKELSQDLKLAVKTNDKKLSSLLDNLDGLVAKLDGLVGDNRDSLTASISNVEEFTKALRQDGPELMANISKATGELRDLLEKSKPELESLAAKANNTVDSLNTITEKVKKGEGTIGKLLTDETLYGNITNTVDSLGKTLSAIERFKTYITFKGDYLTDVNDGKGYFYVTLKPKPDKYYIVGAVSDPVGRIQLTETTTDGVYTREEKVEHELQFTAQFAKRYRDTALRIGLTQNNFGVGLDQFFFKDRLLLALDVWDFSKDEQGAKSPHVRAGFDYFIFKHLFLSAGIDNIFNGDRQTAYVGGGIQFEDEDFKYIFGAMPKVPSN